jgi:hypothetical protein
LRRRLARCCVVAVVVVAILDLLYLIDSSWRVRLECKRLLLGNRTVGDALCPQPLIEGLAGSVDVWGFLLDELCPDSQLALAERRLYPRARDLVVGISVRLPLVGERIFST